MNIHSSPPFQTATLLWQPRPRTHALTVVCKATFALLPGECAPAPDEDAPNEVDDYWNDDERRSLHTACDMIPFKRFADVVLVGHAHAPGGRPVSSLVVRLVVAGIDKAVEVCADRAWTREGVLREGAPFARMSLRWERAAGGPGTANPVGMRADAPLDRYGQIAVPNLQPRGFQVERRGREIPPVGLGPIAPWWPTRREKLRRHAAGWDMRGWTARPLPEDVDAAFFNVAPLDQQVSELRGDEALLLEHLLPDHPRLVTRLPGISPIAVVRRGGESEVLRMRCDTLSIDTDRGVCSLVWRGQVAPARAEHEGQVLISVESNRRTAPAASEDATTTQIGSLLGGATLPFGVTPGAKAASASDLMDGATMMVPPTLAPGPNATLPFREASPWAAAMPLTSAVGASGAAQERNQEDGTGTLFGVFEPVAEVLPFGGGSTNEDGVESGIALASDADKGASPGVPVRLEEDDQGSAPTVPPPGMIGPLATAEMAERGPVTAAEAAPEPAKIETVEAAPKEEEGLPVDRFPIERCAALAASMARRREDRAKILEENDLTEARWEALSGHWQGEILKETRRGRTGLMEAYDSAYVERLEEERGEITVEEYARLTVALERGDVEEVLETLTMPRGAWMRIQRLWLVRITESSTLAEDVGAAIESLREA